ncbi:class I SAM-dependent RNA methyltransferase [Palleronia abyssalis]|uniref:23S rRNA (Uracil(1939)-C(5))-methyltransferase RlmD n=1 Tax=Palleronia abyssalis TaxID=1501240 RepID=A0A2R8BSJ5_9RHOB|nr:class I SAM-dependent RNA methyltransferase [Palleronia abyssalis]SPJ23144.1 23S rRNA (uracil(1939)-C(5))-methyltransferase RlmD [Palleronia abyssalis]
MRLTVERLGHKGDGIAPGPVFVPRALPGEVVEGGVTGDRMEAPVIVERSDARVAPDCPHYDRCGGCSLMHAADPFVGRWKIDVVKQAMAARDLPAPVVGIATSSPRSRRRAVFTGRRTKGDVIVGFHTRRSTDVTAVDQCRVVTPRILDALPALETMTARLAKAKSDLSIQVIDGPAGLDVAVTGCASPDRSILTDLVALAGKAGFARLSVAGEPVLTDRAPYLSLAGVPMTPPPGAFVQATAHAEAALLACVSRALGDARRVVDLFAGCGTFALPVSRRCDLHAVEGDAAMTEALQTAWRKAKGHRPLTAETRDLFRDPLIASELDRFDAAIIDPPRAGAEAQCRELAQSRVPHIAAVSCNPISFARDAAILIEGGYALEWIRVIDQFRWSTHVELAAAFHRA